MDSAPTVTLDDILAKLREMGVSHTHAGEASLSGYSFKSLRRIEEGGVYFFTGDPSTAQPLDQSIVICSAERFPGEATVTIQVADPQLAFYKLMQALAASPARRGVHPTAVVDAAAEVSPEAYVGPYCVLGRCVVGAGVDLHSHVVIMDGSILEDGVHIESHSTIGATGVAWIWDPESRERIMQPQIGGTLIGAGAFLGSDVSIVRGSINEVTEVGPGCVIAHGSKIGHGSRLGRDCHFANNVSLGGNVTLGDRCFLGSAAVVRPMIRLAADTTVGAGAVVVQNVEEEGCLLQGVPARAMDKKTDKLSGVPRSLG